MFTISFVATTYLVLCNVLNVKFHTAEPPYDCWEHLQDGSHVTGVYNVRVVTSLGIELKQVYCDMDTDGGG